MRRAGRLSCLSTVAMAAASGQAVVAVRFTLLLPHDKKHGFPQRLARSQNACMFSPDRICASIGATTAREAVRQFRCAVGPRTRACRRTAARLSARPGGTRRRCSGGFRASGACRRSSLPAGLAAAAGGLPGACKSELAVLAQAVRAGCRWCDVEVDSARQVKPDELRRAAGSGAAC